jgi:hypothetical protein
MSEARLRVEGHVSRGIHVRVRGPEKLVHHNPVGDVQSRLLSKGDIRLDTDSDDHQIGFHRGPVLHQDRVLVDPPHPAPKLELDSFPLVKRLDEVSQVRPEGGLEGDFLGGNHGYGQSPMAQGGT